LSTSLQRFMASKIYNRQHLNFFICHMIYFAMPFSSSSLSIYLPTYLLKLLHLCLKSMVYFLIVPQSSNIWSVIYVYIWIVSLYQRFCQLDRNNCGFIPSDEFLSIPEFPVNPLSQVSPSLFFFLFLAKFEFKMQNANEWILQSLLRMLDGFNFKEFIALLSAFSPRATIQHKIECVYSS